MILLISSASRVLRTEGKTGWKLGDQPLPAPGPEGGNHGKTRFCWRGGVQAHVLGTWPQMKGSLGHSGRLTRPREGRRVSRAHPDRSAPAGSRPRRGDDNVPSPTCRSGRAPGAASGCGWGCWRSS